MKRNMFLIFNHSMTPEQEKDARSSLGVTHIVPLPESLKKVWCNILPDADCLKPIVAPIIEWLSNRAVTDDYVLVQGDFGACYLVVSVAFNRGMIPVYATTFRDADESSAPDGAVNLVHKFRHRRFREYGK